MYIRIINDYYCEVLDIYINYHNIKPHQKNKIE